MFHSEFGILRIESAADRREFCDWKMFNIVSVVGVGHNNELLIFHFSIMENIQISVAMT